MTLVLRQKKYGDYSVVMEVYFSYGRNVYHVSLYQGDRTRLEGYYGNHDEASRCYYHYCSRAKKGAV